MNKWAIAALVVAQLLGAVLSFVAFFTAGFASDSGAADPAGARLSALLTWVPAVFFVCLIASWGLVIVKREKIALALSALPFLYFAIVLLVTGTF